MTAFHPRWMYHPTEPARIVQTAEELDGLDGWADSPAAFTALPVDAAEFTPETAAPERRKPGRARKGTA
jgi:hypothetical protein